MGKSRFLKTIRAKQNLNQSTKIIKIFVKPSQELSLAAQVADLKGTTRHFHLVTQSFSVEFVDLILILISWSIDEIIIWYFIILCPIYVALDKSEAIIIARSYSELGSLRVLEINEQLENLPNCLPYEEVRETEKSVYLVRPFVYMSLYDRIRYLLFHWLHFFAIYLFIIFSTHQALFMFMSRNLTLYFLLFMSPKLALYFLLFIFHLST